MLRIEIKPAESMFRDQAATLNGDRIVLRIRVDEDWARRTHATDSRREESGEEHRDRDQAQAAYTH